MQTFNRFSSFLKRPVIILLILGASVSTSLCQDYNTLAKNSFTGVLLFAVPIIDTVPPISSSQPSEIQTDYLWLDEAFRLVKPGFYLDKYINNLGYNDTSKFIAKVLYKIVDDNPITAYQWMGAAPSPYPYNAPPGRERVVFQTHFDALANDTDRTGFLLNCDFIYDVQVSDTIGTIWDSTFSIHKTVLVKYSILDTIKGKTVPECTDIFLPHKSGIKPQSIDPTSIIPVHAAPGVCSYFEYSPEWTQSQFSDGGTTDPLGNWVKKDSEYIVFLGFVGVYADSLHSYYDISPEWGGMGTSGAMYKVQGGYVVDPNDDFGIGASSGLTVTEWKTRLRARIYKITNP
jgi:hypothetical protein